MSRAAYRYRSGDSPWPALAILIIALLLTLLLPAADLRLLAFLFALPPLLWLALEGRRRATEMTLEVDALHLGRPFYWRALIIPYDRIAGFQPWDRNRLGFVYYVPRPDFEGEADPRPPRLRATVSPPLADRTAALSDLAARLEAAPHTDPRFSALPGEQIQAHLRRRRLRRSGLTVALILASPLLVIAIFRLGFELARALHLGG
jgi:hypothetical protein